MKNLMIRLIRGYQRHLSPALGTNCKYSPTCSQYAIEAIERFGVCKGSCLALWRILRCNPFSRGGFDPVPQRRSAMDR